MTLEYEYWRATHIFLEELERAAGHKLPKLREFREFAEDGVQTSIRIPKAKYKRYGIAEAVEKIGITRPGAIYVNI